MVRPSKFSVVTLILVAAGMGLASGANAKQQSSTRQVVVSPARNTPDASPETQISILGVAPRLIGNVRVAGSESGVHSGRLKKYSGNRGASFVPADPFSDSESVDVKIPIKGRKAIQYSFTIETPGNPQGPLNLPIEQPDKLRHYVSEPGLTPPKITASKVPHKSDGKIFITPLPSPVVHPGSDNAISIHPVGPGGPLIIGPKGNVIWFKQLTRPDYAANLRIQKYHGRKVLTWWQGTVTPSAYGDGEGVIANSHYRTIATVKAGNGYGMDIHEFSLGPKTGDAYFTIYRPVMVHAPGTPEGTLTQMLDAIVQAVDVKTGLVTWEWHSYGHIPQTDSYATPENSSSYDAFHINSIQPLKNGNVLISARDTSALYLLDRPSGKVIWTLGGKSSDFKLGEGARFWFQHDARLQKNGDVTLFDDEAGPPQKAPSSRGLRLRLNHKKMKATVAASYQRNEDTSAQSEGSYQTLPGGNIFLGFGAQPNFSEFSPSGKLLYDASLPVDDGSYRVYRFPWRGEPDTNPAVATESGVDGITAYVSWNGATAVRKWQVVIPQNGAAAEIVKTVKKGGFETAISLPSGLTGFRVRAIDSKGQVIGKSALVSPS
jgi:hypothetical protein